MAFTKTTRSRDQLAKLSTVSRRRLGILQLGLYAHEKNPPFKSLQLMTTDTAIRVPNIIPILAKASEQDASIESTYLCHPSIQYITKNKSEGSFCGYRNIQMMISYILGCVGTDGEPGVEVLVDGIPSILQIQELIERAWDLGINSEGRTETGGIRGTRKHIGTPEVQALFKSLGIQCKFGSAFCSLLDYVEDHFKTRSGPLANSRVNITTASPIYLQRPHHSLTIVGIEFGTDGQRKLLLLDPKSRISPTVSRLTNALTEGAVGHESVSLKEFRRGRWDLGLYRQFETLSLGS